MAAGCKDLRPEEAGPPEPASSTKRTRSSTEKKVGRVPRRRLVPLVEEPKAIPVTLSVSRTSCITVCGRKACLRSECLSRRKEISVSKKKDSVWRRSDRS